MKSRISRIKLIIKHLLGRDVYLKTDENIATRFYGSRYGGWAIPEKLVNVNSVVYSFGIGEDASFDLALIADTGCKIHGFDPTPKSLLWVEDNISNEHFKMYPWALGATDGQLELWLPKNPHHVSASCRPSSITSYESFVAPCKRIETVMKELGHEQVDLLKMDIEGAEYEVLKSMSMGDVL